MLPQRKRKNTKETYDVGAQRFTGTRRSLKDSSTLLLSACLVSNMLFKRGCPLANDLTNTLFCFQLWSLLLTAKSLASQAKNPLKPSKKRPFVPSLQPLFQGPLKFEIFRDVSRHVFSNSCGPTLKRLPEFPDKLFGLFAADVLWCSTQSVCQRNRHRHVFAFEQQIVLRLLIFARMQHRVEVENDDMWKNSVFFFGYRALPLKSCSKHSISSRPTSRIAFLRSNVRAN